MIKATAFPFLSRPGQALGFVLELLWRLTGLGLGVPYLPCPCCQRHKGLIALCLWLFTKQLVQSQETEIVACFLREEGTDCYGVCSIISTSGLLKQGHTYLHLNTYPYGSPTISSIIYPKLSNHVYVGVWHQREQSTMAESFGKLKMVCTFSLKIASFGF